MSSHLGINPQPITKRGIQEHNPQIHCIYTGKKGVMPTYRALKPKEGGTALGTIYEIVREALTPPKSPSTSAWIGKIGRPTGRLRDDPNTIRTRTKKDINLDAIREKLGYDLYQELGRGIFHVPKTRLSLQSVMNDFTLGDSLAWDLGRFGISDSLRIMSRYIEGYQDLHHATIRVEGLDDPLDFITYLHNFHRPPTMIVNPAGKEVPLEGIMGLLAVGRVLGDTDIIGGSGGNAGFVWVKNPAGEIISAQIYKIDPGECFNFKLEEPDRKARLSFSKNWLVNTRAKKANLEIGGGGRLEDERDLQIAQSDSRVTLEWKFLSHEQKDEFLSTLFNCSRYLRADEILKYLLYRDGKFNRSPLEQIPEQVAGALQNEIQTWLQLQLEIYRQELQEFKSRYPEHVLRTEYIDRWGELPLPASDQTFPIRELFTQLTLIEAPSESSPAKGSPSELPERDSLLETQERMNLSSPSITLETLFDAHEKQPAPRKVLLLGRAGIGKSTLCQKIAHDWASGRLWSDRYKAIYWLPLRELNKAVEEGGFLFQEKDPDKFVAKAVAHLRLNDPELADSLLSQFQSHRQEIPILLDGLDEASPLLVQSLMPLLERPEFTVFLTSRPGVTEALHPHMDRLVENIGFSKEHISQYVHQFFNRDKVTSETSKTTEEKFLAALQKERNLFTVAHIPLILQMLCRQWELGAERVGFAPSLAGLYSDMVEELFRWHCRKGGVDPYAVSGQEKKEVISVLGEIALQGLRQGKLIIPGELAQAVLKNTRVSEKELLRTGLLRATGEGLTREYCFLHLTFQEYVIALFVTQKSSQEQKAFIVEHRCKPQFQLVLSLMAGIIDRQDPTKEKIKYFFDHLHSPPGDLTGFYQLALTIRCLQQCSDSIIQDWIEEKYRVYSTLVHLLQGRQRNENQKDLFYLGAYLAEYLKGSEKIINQIIDVCFQAFGEEDYSMSEEREAVKTIGTLCGNFSPELWAETYERFCQKLEDMPFSHPNIWEHENLVRAKALFFKYAPQGQELRIARSLCEDFKDISRSYRNKWSTATFSVLESLYKEILSEQWIEFFKNLHQDCLNPNWKIAFLSCQELIMLCRHAPASAWPVAFKVLNDHLNDPNPSDLKSIASDNVVEALRALCRSAPSDKWLEAFYAYRKIFRNPHIDRTRLYKTEYPFYHFCSHIPLLPPQSWFEVFQAICQDFEDSDEIVRYEGERVLDFSPSIFEKVPPEKWFDAFQHLLLIIRRSDFQLRYRVVSALKGILEHVSPEKWMEVFRSLLPLLQDPGINMQLYVAVEIARLIEKIPPQRWDETFEAVRKNPKHDTAFILEMLYVMSPTESWHKASQALSQDLGDPDEKIRFQVAKALGLRCKKAPIEYWSQAVTDFAQALVSSDKTIQHGAIVGLEDFITAGIPSARFLEVFHLCRSAIQVANHDKTSQLFISNRLATLCMQSPSESRVEILQVLFQDLRDQNDLVSEESQKAFQVLCEKALSNEEWQQLCAILSQTLMERTLEVWAAFELAKHCERGLPPSLWVSVFVTCLKTIHRASSMISSEEVDIRHAGWDIKRAAESALNKLCKMAPIQLWSNKLFVALFKTLKNSTPDMIASISRSIPLHHLTQHLQFTTDYLVFYFTQLGIRKSPLYIQPINTNQFQIACVENNQEITKLISADEFAQMKQILLADHVLKSYVSRYIDLAASFNLEPVLLWLRQKVPGNWQAKDGEDLALENPQGDPRLLSRAVREFVILADDLEINLQVIKHEKSLVIKGEPQDLEKLLEHLKQAQHKEELDVLSYRH